MNNLPKVLQEISDVAGLGAALQIAHEKGGGRCSIPAKLRPGHWLTELVGLDAAEKIAFHFTSGRGSVEVEIPLGPTGTISRARRLICQMLADNTSSDKIARATGMSRRTVLRQKAKIKNDDDQNRLI